MYHQICLSETLYLPKLLIVFLPPTAISNDGKFDNVRVILRKQDFVVNSLLATSHALLHVQHLPHLRKRLVCWLVDLSPAVAKWISEQGHDSRRLDIRPSLRTVIPSQTLPCSVFTVVCLATKTRLSSMYTAALTKKPYM